MESYYLFSISVVALLRLIQNRDKKLYTINTPTEHFNISNYRSPLSKSSRICYTSGPQFLHRHILSPVRIYRIQVFQAEVIILPKYLPDFLKPLASGFLFFSNQFKIQLPLLRRITVEFSMAGNFA